MMCHVGPIQHNNAPYKFVQGIPTLRRSRGKCGRAQNVVAIV